MAEGSIVLRIKSELAEGLFGAQLALTLQNLWALGAAHLGKECTPQGFQTTQE